MHTPSTTFLSAEELLFLAPCITFDERTAASTVLACRPVTSRGLPSDWRGVLQISLGALLKRTVQVVEGDRRYILTARQHVQSSWADELAAALQHSGRLPAGGLEESPAQLEQLRLAFDRFLEPYQDVKVEALLRNWPAGNGFFDGRRARSLEDAMTEVERLDGLTRVTQVLIDGHLTPELKLNVWRKELFQVVGPSEELFDVRAVLSNLAGEVVAFADLRVAIMPAQTRVAELVALLEPYDALGLEIALALNRRLGPGGASAQNEFFDGSGFAYLHAFEVREDLRGQKLGMKMLRAALGALTRGWNSRRVTKLVVSVCPLQFDYPLHGLPAELLVEGLDAAESFQDYFTRSRPQDALLGADHSAVWFVGAEPAARGSHLEQVRAIAELTQEPLRGPTSV